MRRLILGALLGLLFVPGTGWAQFENTPGDQMVREWYRRFLGRPADASSAMWVDAIKQGQAPDTVLSQILASAEFYIRCGSTTEGFVRRLHTELTGREPGPREVQFWAAQVYRSDRQDVAYQMLQRYPQNWGAGPGPGPGPGPGGYDREDPRRYPPPPDPYDYRRPPYYRYYRR